uniref:Protein kinase domain-containing protein n=1 Tax=Mycena chlorophos TaxID=658473 RepID=A0ABQ0LM81_MYCCL|nr:predicted protein [Mycena chlorophos]
MLRQIQIEFEARKPERFVATLWRGPGINGSFCGLSTDTGGLLKVANSNIFINSNVNDDRIEFPVEEIPQWGLDDESRVVFARVIAENGQSFCLRFIFNLDKARQSRNARLLDKLLRDAKFCAESLPTLAGVIVPRHYGIWAMETGGWAGRVLFSVTQWCGTPWKTLMGTQLDTALNRLLVGRTLEMFHDLGFIHNGDKPEPERS